MRLSRCAKSACTSRFIIIRARCGINAVRTGAGTPSRSRAGRINSIPPATVELDVRVGSAKKNAVMEYGGTTMRSVQFVQEMTAPMPSSFTASFWPQFRQ